MVGILTSYTLQVMDGSGLLHRLDESLNRLIARRPWLAGNTVRYGWGLLVGLTILLLAVGVVTADGRSQEIIYATEDGSVVSLEPESGAITEIYAGSPDRYATSPARTGGRNVSFTVLQREGESLRGDLYSADLARNTRALTERAEPDEVFADSSFSEDGTWLLASRYATGDPTNVLVLPASGATEQLLEPDMTGAAPILAPIWGAENTVFAWRRGPAGLALTAYNFFERRQAVVYETDKRVGTPYYYDSNTVVFDERPEGTDLTKSRVKLLVGTGEIAISGTEGLGLYDPAPIVSELDDVLPVMWTDGRNTGVGLIDSKTWSFSKTGVTAEAESRSPRISRDGSYIATTDASGTTLTVRRMEDGVVVRRVDDVQPPGTALDRMRQAGFEVTEKADWFAPTFSWRSLDDG